MIWLSRSAYEKFNCLKAISLVGYNKIFFACFGSFKHLRGNATLSVGVGGEGGGYFFHSCFASLLKWIQLEKKRICSPREQILSF